MNILRTPLQTGSLESVAQVLTRTKEVDFKMSIANPVEEVNPWEEPTNNANGAPKLPNPDAPISGILQRADGTFYNPATGSTMVQKDGAWVEVVVPGQGDPTAEQRLAEEEAKRKRLYLIGGILFFTLILLIFLVKALKKNKQN